MFKAFDRKALQVLFDTMIINFSFRRFDSMVIFPKSCDLENWLLLRRKLYLTEGDKLPVELATYKCDMCHKPIEDIDKE